MALELKKYPVAPSLQPFLNSYYIIEGSELRMPNHPQGTVDLMFALNNGVEFLSKNPGNGSLLHDTFIVPQQDQPFQFHFLRQCKLLGVCFKPEGFYKILKLPLLELTNRSFPISDLLPNVFGEISERLKEVSDDLQTIELIEQFLINQFYQADAQLEPFDKMLPFIRKQKGIIPVADLASELFVSRRTLHRLFINRLGISPKTYSKVVQFQSALNQLYQQPDSNWTSILYDCGYYDQMHFIKDFKRFTGKTPSEFMKSDYSFSNFFHSISF